MSFTFDIYTNNDSAHHSASVNADSEQRAINSNYDQITDKKSIRVMVALSVIMMLTFIHSSIWGRYSSEIIELKTKQFLGMMSSADHRRLANICSQRVKLTCVEKALVQLYATTSDVEVLGELASLQMRAGQYTNAEINFTNYFKLGGVSSLYSYEFAKMLESSNKVEEAARYYDRALVNKPETLQITIVQSYVNMLIKNNRFLEAKTVIDSVRAQAESAKSFMTREYDQIAAALVSKK